MNNKEYLVVRCPRCGNLLLSRPEYRSRRCMHCGNVMPMSSVSIVGRASSSTEASELVRELKAKGKQRI